MAVLEGVKGRVVRRRQLESTFEEKLIKRLETMFPGCVILKLDAGNRQGIPDRLILWGDHWAILEVKRGPDEAAKPEPNQEFYVDMFNEMSFSAFIYPENMEEVLHEIQRAFSPTRKTRVAKR
jgi:hypothetical protein